jgi:RNA-splicing ligase RtcB
MSSVTPLAAALIGAGSAVFGGFSTTSGQLLIERGRAKRESAANEERQAQALRLAVRLVTEELAESTSLIEAAAKSRRYWVAPRQLPAATWREYRTDIAVAIESPLDWRFITSAYDGINNLNWIVQHRRNTDQSVETPVLGARVSEDDHTREVWRGIRQAIGALESTIGVTGPASRVLREPEDAEREYWPHGDGSDFDREKANDAVEREYYEQEARRQEGY